MGFAFDLPPSALEWLTRRPRQPVVVADTHTGGNPTRIVLSGITFPSGVSTVGAARAWLRDNADHWRRRLVHEPRGGGLTCAVVPLHTHEDDCDIGAVILEPGSYPPMCGHCMIGLASAVVELNLLPDLWVKNPAETRFRIRAPAGPIGVTARREDGRLASVTLTNVESFWVSGGTCEVDGRTIPTELLYGGDYYITVDADQIGLDLGRGNVTEIVHLARRLKDAYTKGGVRDPLSGAALDVYQVMFFRHEAGTARAKVVVVAPPGVIDRSPCGTGSSALYAKFVTQGLLRPDETLTTESIIGSTFTVDGAGAREAQGRVLVTPLLTGIAYINGFLTIAADEEDPLADGFAPL